MDRQVVRRALCATAATILIAACVSDPGEPYPLPAGPPGARQLNPATVGAPMNAVVMYIQVRPGDRIELVGAEAVGTLDGAAVTLLLSRPVNKADGTRLIGEAMEPLEGAILTPASTTPGPENDVGIVARMTPAQPGRYQVTGVRLRYRLNGGPEQVGEGIDTIWTVCADTPKPADCPDEVSE